MLFIRLAQPKKLKIVQIIVENLDILLKNMISFKAIVCLLETPLGSQAQDLVISYLSKIEATHYISHTRYLKILESFISCLSDSKLDFMVEIISKNIFEFLDSKQGYFLVRKIFKHTKQEKLQYTLAYSIASNLKKFIDNNNGVLLMQCLIKYFTQSKVRIENPSVDSTSFNKKIISKAIKIEQDSGSYLQQSDNKNDNDDSNSGPGSCSNNPIVLLLFKLFIKEILISYSTFSYNSNQTKGHRKILSLFFSNCGDYTRECLLVTLASEDTLNQIQIIKELINLDISVDIIASIMEYELLKNKCDLFTLCYHLNINNIPQNLQSQWKTALSTIKSKLIKLKLLQHDVKYEESHKFNSKLYLADPDEYRQDQFEEELNDNRDDFDEFVSSNKSFFEISDLTERTKNQKSKNINSFVEKPTFVSLKSLNVQINKSPLLTYPPRFNDNRSCFSIYQQLPPCNYSTNYYTTSPTIPMTVNHNLHFSQPQFRMYPSTLINMNYPMNQSYNSQFRM